MAFVLAVCWSFVCQGEPRAVFLISEPEYHTEKTLPEFARAELVTRGVECVFVIPPADHPDDFEGLEALRKADLLVVSVRRHAPTAKQMKLLRDYVASGKPVVGIRTASHAFTPNETDAKLTPGHVPWPEFDREILGGNYQNHYGAGIATYVKSVAQAAGHPVLAGIGPEEFKASSHLYRNPNLPDFDTILMTGRLENDSVVEPIAWVNTHESRRVFYTSLGAEGDFEIPQFRRLLRNGVFWAMGVSAP